MSRKLGLSLICIASLGLAACGGDADTSDDEATQSSSSSAPQSEDSEDAESSDSSTEEGTQTIYEVGETAKLKSISNLADTTYELTLDSVEFAPEYDGESITEYIINAPDDMGFLAVNLTMKNTGDEAYMLDMTLQPLLGDDPSTVSEYPVEWFADKGLTKEVAPGAEEPIVLVFATSDYYANEDGDLFLQFEPAASQETYFRIPGSVFE